VIRAIAAAWEPDDYEIWTGDIEIDDDGNMADHAEEVKRVAAGI
jgi:hypothetical protein